MCRSWRRHLASFAVLVVATEAANEVVIGVVDWTGSVELAGELPAPHTVTASSDVHAGEPSTMKKCGAAGISVLQTATFYHAGGLNASVAATPAPAPELAPKVDAPSVDLGKAGAARTAIGALLLRRRHKLATKKLGPPGRQVAASSLLEGRRSGVAAAAPSPVWYAVFHPWAQLLPTATLDWMQNLLVRMSTPAPPAVIQSRKRRMREGLILELHLPAVSLQALHSSKGGSVASFLLDLRGELGLSAGLPDADISILGIHERYTRSTRAPGKRKWTSVGTPNEEGKKENRETLVRFAILADNNSSSDPQKALDMLKGAIGSTDSTLMVGKLGYMLKNCTIALELTDGLRLAPSQGTRNSQIAAMAMPIGISAALTGILIWLATT